MKLALIEKAAALRLRGYSNDQIAKELKVEPALIDRHTNAIQFEVGLILARAN